ncbi:MAG TPA: amidohydrolase family protein [Roseiflexaceae bacterium]|nr:amidohydrolase family protein [Roseiflexaceae bacterium]HMP38949.1 amidohydrolase family protein [Roseiflexaceae bacterium]
MIIDVHSHTPQYRDAVPEDELVINTAWRPDRTVVSSVSWADYLAHQAPAAVSIVFAVAWHPGIIVPKLGGREVGDTSWYQGNINDATATFVKAHPERLIGFMALHPHDPACLDEFERCRSDLGLRGVKLGANYQNFDPLEARALAIYERAQRYGMPVLFHQGTSPVRNAPIRLAHPLLMDEIAMRYPDLKIIMAHMGHPWQADTCVVIRKHPNLYADVSGNFYRPFSFWEQLIRATEWNVLDKLLLGSDYPIVTVQETIDGLRNVNRIVEGTHLPRVPEAAIEALIERDSLALLGLR